MPHQIICSRYTGRWWTDCYIWYSEEGTGWGHSLPRPLLAVTNLYGGNLRGAYLQGFISLNPGGHRTGTWHFIWLRRDADVQMWTTWPVAIETSNLTPRPVECMPPDKFSGVIPEPVPVYSESYVMSCFPVSVANKVTNKRTKLGTMWPKITPCIKAINTSRRRDCSKWTC